jgi:hypothetical protein
MDYKAFYSEVADWINHCNQMAMKNGLDSDAFWQWVARSLGELTNKYENNPLVSMQMTMLFQWLEGVYEDMKGKTR